MSWSADFSMDAEQDIASLSKAVRVRILERIEWLTQAFDSIVPIPLRNEWRGFYKLRIGDYRVVYKIMYEERTLRIEYIDHRSRIYKRRP